VGVWRFNVESHDELQTLQRVAAGQGVLARASVRINPDVDAGTHAKISTGKSENKFGVSIAEARRWFAESAQYPDIRLDGLHAHIGSQILRLAPFRLALQRVAEFAWELAEHGHVLSCIDVGGGLGVRYRQDQEPPLAADEYAAMLRETFTGFAGTLILEPGRYLVAEAGLLLTRAIRVKPGQQRDFLIIDAAMNDLQRPALYDAWHDILPLHGRDAETVAYDVVGPVCETGDTFALQRRMPACRAGDLIAIAGAGAYGASMASTYNSRPLAAEVLLDSGRYALVRRRQDFDAMIADERPAQEWQIA
jgi:diaminopimelate decarboxylase